MSLDIFVPRDSVAQCSPRATKPRKNEYNVGFRGRKRVTFQISNFSRQCHSVAACLATVSLDIFVLRDSVAQCASGATKVAKNEYNVGRFPIFSPHLIQALLGASAGVGATGAAAAVFTEPCAHACICMRKMRMHIHAHVDSISIPSSGAYPPSLIQLRLSIISFYLIS